MQQKVLSGSVNKKNNIFKIKSSPIKFYFKNQNHRQKLRKLKEVF